MPDEQRQWELRKGENVTVGCARENDLQRTAEVECGVSVECVSHPAGGEVCLLPRPGRPLSSPVLKVLGDARRTRSPGAAEHHAITQTMSVSHLPPTPGGGRHCEAAAAAATAATAAALAAAAAAAAAVGLSTRDICTIDVIYTIDSLDGRWCTCTFTCTCCCCDMCHVHETRGIVSSASGVPACLSALVDSAAPYRNHAARRCCTVVQLTSAPSGLNQMGSQSEIGELACAAAWPPFRSRWSVCWGTRACFGFKSGQARVCMHLQNSNQRLTQEISQDPPLMKAVRVQP